MDDAKLLAYEPMWTTEHDEWWLGSLPSGALMPLHRVGDRDMMCVICDDELAQEVIRRMVTAGVDVRAIGE